MAAYEYQPLELGPSRFRLLRLLKHSGVDLRCELEPLSLSNKTHTRYEALSYTWGSEELVERIILNGKQFWVTDNLYTALKFLQLSDKDRYLWIDAICINQADKKEQKNQVQQMDAVFKSADTVLFWLGKATFEITTLLESLTRLQSAARDSDQWTLDDPRWKALWKASLPAEIANTNIKLSPHYKGLQQMLKRPWFSRVWILQEVAYAKEARVCASKYSVPAYIFILCPSLFDIDLTSHCQSVLEIMPGRSRSNSWWAEERNLYTLLQRFQGCKATNERDMIFALLSLSSNERDRQSINITYEDPVHQVIHNAVRYLIQATPIMVYEVLNLLSSFRSINTTYFVLASTEERAEEIIFPRNQSGKRLSAVKETNTAVDQVYVTKDLASLYLEERPEKDLNDADSCYSQVIDLLQRVNKDDEEATKTRANSLRVISWGSVEKHVKIVIIQDLEAAMFAAAHQGYDQVVKQLQQTKVSWKKEKGFSGSALEQAIEHENLQAILIILEQGADINAQGGRYGNALLTASHGGHEQIVKLLLNKDADTNAQGGILYGNALQAASYGGHEQIVKLLLDKDADVNAQGGYYGNALQAALASGHEQIVKLLLNKDADVNAQGGYYGNALQAASDRGHEQIVKLLLDKDADVNAQGGYYGNALQAALARGHEQIVKLLLNKDADVNAQGGFYGNALQAASDRGYEQIVRLLKQAGAYSA